LTGQITEAHYGSQGGMVKLERNLKRIKEKGPTLRTSLKGFGKGVTWGIASIDIVSKGLRSPKELLG